MEEAVRRAHVKRIHKKKGGWGVLRIFFFTLEERNVVFKVSRLNENKEPVSRVRPIREIRSHWATPWHD